MPSRSAKSLASVFGALLAATLAGAQSLTVSGVVTAPDGEPLAFATVAVVGADSLGTTAGLDGAYVLTLDGPPAGRTLAFRYVGYEDARRDLPDAGPPTRRLDVTLQPARFTLETASVSAAAEDPAYRIMREAAARRRGYLRAVERYEAEVYVKGQVYVAEAPERVMGRDVGNMGGLLDSSRAGIVYLSETFSTVQYERPGKFRETITAASTSGDPRGFSFNTATALDFDLYERTADFGRPVLSPLVEDAPSVYAFSLEGARRDERDRLVYKIRLAPRRRTVPAYSGLLYVEDGSFHVLDADLVVAGAALNAPGLDSLRFVQSYARMSGGNGDGDDEREDVWVTRQRRVAPYLSLLKFRFRGEFVGVYRDYDLSPAWAASPFGRVISETLPSALGVDTARFAERRPIPLAAPERNDYRRKDSIRRRVTSVPYRDSVEAERNAFSIDALLGGYTRSNWREHRRVSYLSPLSRLGFHPVTGLRLGVGLSLEQDSDEDATRTTSARLDLDYGLSDRQLYPSAELSVRLDPLYRQTLTVRGGRALVDYHRLGPVEPLTNAVYALMAKRSDLRVYEWRFGELAHETQLHRRVADRVTPPFATLRHALAIGQRGFRQNTTEYSIRDRDEEYASNLPQPGRPGRGTSLAPIPIQTLLRYGGTLSFQPTQRYLLRPDAIVPTEATAPSFDLSWRLGQRLGGGDEGGAETSFLYVGLSAKHRDVRLGRVGRLGARGSVGRALYHRGARYVADVHQFGGNPRAANAIGDYLDNYLALDYFDLATAGTYLDGVVEHDFDGWLWQRLPLLRRLGWTVVARAGGIYLPETRQTHAEVGVALNNVGFGLARFLRVDVAWAAGREQGEALRGRVFGGPNWRLGVVLPAELLVE